MFLSQLEIKKLQEELLIQRENYEKGKRDIEDRLSHGDNIVKSAKRELEASKRLRENDTVLWRTEIDNERVQAQRALEELKGKFKAQYSQLATHQDEYRLELTDLRREKRSLEREIRDLRSSLENERNERSKETRLLESSGRTQKILREKIEKV